MLAANGVDLGDIRFGGAEQVAVAAAAGVQAAAVVESTGGGDRNGESACGNFGRCECECPTKLQVQLDEAQAAEMRDRFSRIIGDYVKAKTGKADARRIDCDVAERQLAQLAGGHVGAGVRGRRRAVDGPADGLSCRSRRPREPVQVPVYADVAAPAVPVVVAMRPIARGDVITAADVEVRDGRAQFENERPAGRGRFDRKAHWHGSAASDPGGRRRVRRPGAVADAGEARRVDHRRRRKAAAFACGRAAGRCRTAPRATWCKSNRWNRSSSYDARVVGIARSGGVRAGRGRRRRNRASELKRRDARR